MLEPAKLPTEYLPASIKELLRVLDTPTVYALIEEFGGTRLCVPKVVSPDHELVGLIGLDALQVLCQLFGGGVFDCPRCLKALNVLRDNEMLAKKRAGLTIPLLARHYCLTERGVSKALRRVEKQELQERLQHSQMDWLMAS